MVPKDLRTLLFILLITLTVVSSSERRAISVRRDRVRRSLVCGARPVIRATKTNAPSSTDETNHPPDHPEWAYLNALPWYKTDPTQQDHARFHSYLSMAVYGDYRSQCPSTFKKGFTVLEDFKTSIGQTGFIALVPEMEKVVIVFKGYGDYQSLDWDTVSIESMISNCSGCQVAKGVRDLYISAKKATNDFEVAKKEVAKTRLKFSVTGHGVGGAVSALAALDLGARDLVHYSHNQGTPRAFNYAAVVRYSNLFQVLAGQSLVAENDYMVQAIPSGTFYHVGTKVRISGPKQQWLVNCYGYNENSTCIGDGSNVSIHKSYFTPISTCGSSEKGF